MISCLEASVPWRAILTIALVVTAVVLCTATPLRNHLGPDALDALAGTLWAAPALVVLYIVTFALAIPGSALFIAAGLVFEPLLATLLGVIGGTIGSLVAHAIGRVLGAEARERWRRRRGFKLVEASVDFPGLLALRLLPAFPHSVVNYGSGIVGAPVSAFAAASAIGLAVKSFVYAKVAYEASRSGTAINLFRADVWGVLLLLAGVSLLAKVAVRRREARLAAATPVPPPGAAPRSATP